MYEADFELETVTDRLKSEFAVEQQVPLDIALRLEHLHRREHDRHIAKDGCQRRGGRPPLLRGEKLAARCYRW